MSGKCWRSLASVTLASLLPCSARADSSIAAQAVTDVVVSFGTPSLVPQASQPASDPPAPDPQPPPSVPHRLPALVGDGAPTALACDLCQTSRPAYRLEGHTRRGVVISGAVIGGIGFGFAIAVAAEGSESTSGWNGVPFDLGGLALPVLGPWISLGTLKPNCGGKYGDEPGGCTRVHTQDAWATILIVDGLVQLAGATLIVVGLAFPRQELVITETAKARVVPVRLGSTGHGLALVGTL